MAIQHSAIPDAQLHEAKGASTATAGQVLKANGGGTTSFVAPNTLSNISISSTLEAFETVTQGPAALDTAYQVTFGAGTSDANASIASNGIITISTTGLYLITVALNVGRATNVGITKTVFRMKVNGVETGFNRVVQMDTSVNYQPLFMTQLRSFTATNTITVEMLRDSTGVNEGSLYIFDPALAGWANVPSAAVRVQRILGGA